MNTTTSFSELGLSQGILTNLAKVGFDNASAIQELTIAPIVEGKDIFAQAETGSGKTGSFVIPVLEKLLRAHPEGELENKVYYVCLSPTRELAQQTQKVFTEIGSSLGVKSTLLIGGENIEKQKELLNLGTHILVATPGRLLDLLKQKAVAIKDCHGIILDEADRLFDMGFQKDIEAIFRKAPENRQLIMVSATSNMEVINTAFKFKSVPMEIKLNADDLVVDNIDHQKAMISKDEKMPLLVNLLRKHEDVYAIVFCNTQFQTHCVAEWLKLMGFKAKPISGRMAQNKRTRLMEEFKSKKVTILVCTDVAARGLDIDGINLVINYDLPIEAANYVHRIGRTGRAGKSGKAVSFVGYEDCENLDAIYEFIEGEITSMDLSDEDFATDVCEKPYIDKKTLKVTDKPSRDESRDRGQRNSRSDRKTSARDKNTRKQGTANKEMRNKNQNAERENKVKRDDTTASNVAKVDRRFFEYTSSNKSEALGQALQFFKLEDKDLIEEKVLAKGRRKFFIFGPRTITYKFSVKAHFKKLLLPFLIKTIKLADLQLYARVSYKDKSLRVNFSGKDEPLLKENNFELLMAFEQLCKTYLMGKVVLPRGLRYSFRANNQENNKEKQEKYLLELAKKMQKKVLESKKPVTLKPLNPAERRIVHEFFHDSSELTTKSLGDGKYKKIEISLK